MNCKKIQKFILADYLDAETKPDLTAKIKAHLESCRECRELEQRLQKEVVLPLRKVEQLKPSESVWAGIEQRLDEQETAEPLVERLSEKLRQQSEGIFGWLDTFRKPAFAFATLGVIFIVSITLLKQPADNTALVENYLQEQVIFHASFEYEVLDTSDDDFIDFGSDIEEYFL